MQQFPNPQKTNQQENYDPSKAQTKKIQDQCQFANLKVFLITQDTLAMPKSNISPLQLKKMEQIKNQLSQSRANIYRQITTFKFTNLKVLCMRECFFLQNLQFLTFMDAPLLTAIDVRRCVAIGILKPLKKILSTHLKKIAIESFSINSLGGIERIKLYVDPLKLYEYPTIMIKKTYQDQLSLMTAQMNILAKVQFQTAQEPQSKLKGLRRHQIKLIQAKNAVYSKIRHQDQYYFKKRKFVNSLQGRQIDKLRKLSAKFNSTNHNQQQTK